MAFPAVSSPIPCLMFATAEDPDLWPPAWPSLPGACILGTALSGCGFESATLLPSWTQFLEPKVPYSTIHTGHGPLESLPRPLSLLAICSGQYALLSLPFSSGTVLIKPLSGCPLDLKLVESVPATSLPNYTRSAVGSGETHDPRGQKPGHLGSPCSSRGSRILELLMPHLQHRLETPWTCPRSSTIS